MRKCLPLFFILFIAHSSFAQKSKKDYSVYVDSGFTVAVPERGAHMTGFFEQDSLVRIEAFFGFNFGDLRRNYYYDNNQLIMIIESQRLYNNNPGNKINADSVKINYEGRYLFLNNTLNSVKQNGHFSFMDMSADKQTMQDTFLKTSDDYKRIILEKSKKKKNRIYKKKS